MSRRPARAASHQTSTSLLLKNESAEALRFQVTAFAWTNAIDGEMKLESDERHRVLSGALLDRAGPDAARARRDQRTCDDA